MCQPSMLCGAQLFFIKTLLFKVLSLYALCDKEDPHWFNFVVFQVTGGGLVAGFLHGYVTYMPSSSWL